MSDIDLIARSEVGKVSVRVGKLEGDGCLYHVGVFIILVATAWWMFFEVTPMCYSELRHIDPESPMADRLRESLADDKVTILEWVWINTTKAYDFEKAKLREHLK
jgi:hypothetical protein